MSPVPLIARQRALSRIGEIRLGDEKHDGKVGRKLATFRLTSQHKEVLDRAAELFGGEVKSWTSPTGEAWQVITERSSLDVLVIPGYSLRRAYEKWDGPSKRVRVCDGEDEFISGQPCLCNAVGLDECKLLTRLMVLLPETGTSLGWQLSSTGETAADELDLAMKIAEGLSQGRPFVPGTLSITQRKGQRNGQATRFVVPVLGFNPQQVEPPTSQVQIPQGYSPVPELPQGNGVSLARGLEVAESQVATRTARSAAPIPQVADDIGFGDAPVPVEDPGAAVGSSPSTAADSPLPSPSPEPLSGGTSQAAADDDPPEKPLTLAQAKKKMDAIVGQLRKSQTITTQQLWSAMANQRSIGVEDMISLLGGRDEEGVLHWAPLRDSLDLEEARALHARLARLYASALNQEGA